MKKCSFVRSSACLKKEKEGGRKDHDDPREPHWRLPLAHDGPRGPSLSLFLRSTEALRLPFYCHTCIPLRIWCWSSPSSRSNEPVTWMLPGITHICARTIKLRSKICQLKRDVLKITAYLLRGFWFPECINFTLNLEKSMVLSTRTQWFPKRGRIQKGEENTVQWVWVQGGAQNGFSSTHMAEKENEGLLKIAK